MRQPRRWVLTGRPSFAGSIFARSSSRFSALSACVINSAGPMADLAQTGRARHSTSHGVAS